MSADPVSVRPAPTSLPRGSADPFALPAGTRLSEFEVRRVLGCGGFGIVYLAHDASLHRDVALKEYLPASLAGRSAEGRVVARSLEAAEAFDAGLKSFVNEARLLARFDHPSLVKVHRFWEANGTAYMVMPYYQGATLRQVRKSLGEPPGEAWLRRLLDGLLGAVEALHRADIVHRDVAPDNILMLPDGAPVLLDFGAARQVLAEQTQALTAMLKPTYAPIEQYADAVEFRQGPWTDHYAIAATLHYCLTGEAPPNAAARALNDRYRPLHQRTDLLQHDGQAYDRHWLAALDWALEVRPDRRPQSIAQWRTVLEGRHPVPSQTVRLGGLMTDDGRAAEDGFADDRALDGANDAQDFPPTEVHARRRLRADPLTEPPRAAAWRPPVREGVAPRAPTTGGQAKHPAEHPAERHAEHPAERHANAATATATAAPGLADASTSTVASFRSSTPPQADVDGAGRAHTPAEANTPAAIAADSIAAGSIGRGTNALARTGAATAAATDVPTTPATARDAGPPTESTTEPARAATASAAPIHMPREDAPEAVVAAADAAGAGRRPRIDLRSGRVRRLIMGVSAGAVALSVAGFAWLHNASERTARPTLATLGPSAAGNTPATPATGATSLPTAARAPATRAEVATVSMREPSGQDTGLIVETQAEQGRVISPPARSFDKPGRANDSRPNEARADAADARSGGASAPERSNRRNPAVAKAGGATPSPQAYCASGDRNWFSRMLCMHQSCNLPKWRDHPQCANWTRPSASRFPSPSDPS